MSFGSCDVLEERDIRKPELIDLDGAAFFSFRGISRNEMSKKSKMTFPIVPCRSHLFPPGIWCDGDACLAATVGAGRGFLAGRPPTKPPDRPQ